MPKPSVSTTFLSSIVTRLDPELQSYLKMPKHEGKRSQMLTIPKMFFLDFLGVG